MISKVGLDYVTKLEIGMLIWSEHIYRHARSIFFLLLFKFWFALIGYWIFLWFFFLLLTYIFILCFIFLRLLLLGFLLLEFLLLGFLLLGSLLLLYFLIECFLAFTWLLFLFLYDFWQFFLLWRAFRIIPIFTLTIIIPFIFCFLLTLSGCFYCLGGTERTWLHKNIRFKFKTLGTFPQIVIHTNILK